MAEHALPRHTSVAIVGTGFSGLGTAIRLKQAGRTDFVVLERADDVGGTWRDNAYPGAACDVPSRLYSFSFALNPDWSASARARGGARPGDGPRTLSATAPRRRWPRVWGSR